MITKFKACAIFHLQECPLCHKMLQAVVLIIMFKNRSQPIQSTRWSCHSVKPHNADLLPTPSLPSPLLSWRELETKKEKITVEIWAIHWKQQWGKKTNSKSNNINKESVQERQGLTTVPDNTQLLPHYPDLEGTLSLCSWKMMGYRISIPSRSLGYF